MLGRSCLRAQGSRLSEFQEGGWVGGIVGGETAGSKAHATAGGERLTMCQVVL